MKFLNFLSSNKNPIKLFLIFGKMSSEQKLAPSSSQQLSTANEKKLYLKDIVNAFLAYDSLKDKVSALEKGQQLTVEGMVIDKTVLRTMRSDIMDRIKNLDKVFSTTKAKKSKVLENGEVAKPRRNGFDNPVYVSQYIVDFFTKNQTSLGVDPKTGKLLSALLTNLNNKKLTSSTILTNLWTIYSSYTQKSQVSVQAMELDPKTNKQKKVSYLTADQNMHNCFGAAGSNTFAYLTSKPHEVSAKTGKDKTVFNPSRFAYTGWQSIFSHNSLSADKQGLFHLSPQQDAHLKLLKEWSNLSTKSADKLSENDKIIIQCVNAGVLPNGATPEQQNLVRSYISAKADLDSLDNEKQTASDALQSLKAAAGVTEKKGRGKKTEQTVAAVQQQNGFLPLSGSSMAMPLSMAVPTMK